MWMNLLVQIVNGAVCVYVLRYLERLLKQHDVDLVNDTAEMVGDSIVAAVERRRRGSNNSQG